MDKDKPDRSVSELKHISIIAALEELEDEVTLLRRLSAEISNEILEETAEDVKAETSLCIVLDTTPEKIKIQMIRLRDIRQDLDRLLFNR